MYGSITESVDVNPPGPVQLNVYGAVPPKGLDTICPGKIPLQETLVVDVIKVLKEMAGSVINTLSLQVQPFESIIETL